jgi:hypothetical protein
MDYNGFFASALDRLRDERRYRVFADLERIAGRFPHAYWHAPEGRREVVIWCSNDYLGMAQHPKVIGAMVDVAARMGTGAGGTRNIAGTNHPLVELERELADLHGKQAALLFTSGYVSNQTGIPTLAKLLPNCLILSDALNHNSMIEGVRQAGCEKQVWRHNDIGHLEELLKAADPRRPKLILFESLYSMDGDVDHGADHLRVLGHAEIVVGTPDHDLALALGGVPIGVRKAAGDAFEIGEYAITPLIPQFFQGDFEKPVVVHDFSAFPPRRSYPFLEGFQALCRAKIRLIPMK